VLLERREARVRSLLGTGPRGGHAPAELAAPPRRASRLVNGRRAMDPSRPSGLQTLNK
jgi:hypothetical protein